MLTMTDWVKVLKAFGYVPSKREISMEIKSTCLSIPHKVFGTYQVNDDAVWNNIVLANPSLCNSFAQEKILDPIDLISYLEEKQYREMWMDYRSAFKKNRR